MRCAGQGYSITLALPADEALTAAVVPILKREFDTVYRRIYGHPPPDVPLEIVALRARIEQPRATTTLTRGDVNGEGTVESAIKGHRAVYFEAADGFVETAIYDRYQLPRGQTIDGPAIIEERETAIVVGPDAMFSLDTGSNLIIDFKA